MDPSPGRPAAPPAPADSPARRAWQRVAVGAVAVLVVGGLGAVLALQPPGDFTTATPAEPSPTASPSPSAPPEAPPAAAAAEAAASGDAPTAETVTDGPLPTPTPSGATTVVPVPVESSQPTQTQEPPATWPTPTPVPWSGPVILVDEGWLVATAQKTGIPARALDAYGSADLTVATEHPRCALGWNTLAAIGYVESRHGSFGGSTLGGDGVVRPPVVGIPLDGSGVAHIPDSDGGRYDGDTRYDRAVGPMQFIPGTWARWGTDANGDGVADPQNIDDATLTAARYLCASGDLTTAESWRRAILSYNRSDAYVAKIAEVAAQYARASQG